MDEDIRSTSTESDYKTKTSSGQGSSQVEWNTSFGTFRKRILHPGKGYKKPSDLGTICIVSMTVSEVLSNLDLGYPLGVDVKLQTGEGDTEMSEVIDKCINSMKECEVCTLSIIRHAAIAQDNSIEMLSKENSVDKNLIKLSSSHSDTENKTNASEIQNLNDSFIKIELKSFEIRHIWKLGVEKKFSLAKNQKEKGVELFQNGNYEQSFKRFSKCLRYLISMTPNSQIPSSICSEFRLLRCRCYLNMAACQLKYKNFSAAKVNCTKALNIEPQNVKGLYRRAQACLGQWDLYSARNDLLMATEIEPGNKAVKTLISQVKKRQEEESLM